MSSNIDFLGWCDDGPHDKVWGAISMNRNQRLIFWGRRGTKLSYKIKELSADKYWDLIRDKNRSGYTRYTYPEQIHIDLESQIKKLYVWASLKA
jgi:predicted DNA-binding WGR domain protein